jgi:hypothetical protein
MISRLGEVIYWACCSVFVITALFSLGFFMNGGKADCFLPGIAGFFFFLFGRAVLYVFSAR